jgi:predicted nuclease with TOPRIM domain
MPKSQSKKNQYSGAVTEARLEKLLSDQTAVILEAVDERFRGVNRRLARLEGQYDRLLRTLNKFLKRMTDLEEEFTFMKEDLKRVKAVIREKLGVSLD